MLTKEDLSSVRIIEDELIIRKIEEKDSDTFAEYTSPDHFEQALSDTDTLGVFIGNEMVGAFISYRDVKNEPITADERKGTALGYSCRKDRRNKGIMSKALSALSKQLLDELDFVFLEIEKNNAASRHAAVNACFDEYGEKEDMVFYIRCR